MVPDGWQLPPPDLLVEAERKALQAMRTDGPYPAPDRLARFYDADGDYAGASFAQLGPVDPMDITPTDLLATTLLSVRIRPGAARRMLHSGRTRDNLLRKLSDIPDCDLANAGIRALTAMEQLYEAVKQALSADTVKNPNAWVTASKLCARKRPDLFPVRDKEVCDYLGQPQARKVTLGDVPGIGDDRGQAQALLAADPVRVERLGRQLAPVALVPLPVRQ
jgi:hypothetical protein